MRRSGSLVVRAASSTGSSVSQPSRPSGRVSSEQILRCLTARSWKERSAAGLVGILRMLIGMRAMITHQERKKIRQPSSGGGKSVETFVRKIALPHIDLYGQG